MASPSGQTGDEAGNGFVQTMVLFCLPPAGMGAGSAFEAWPRLLAGTTQVVPIELPGKGARLREPYATDLCKLAVDVVNIILPQLRQGPYALFGHSLGAWLAFEVVQELMRRQEPLPVILFASANRAPQLHGLLHEVDCTQLHAKDATAFWEAFTRRYGHNPHLESPAMRQYMLPMLQADFQLVETYKPSSPSAPLPVPITVFAGTTDPRYTRQQVSAWRLVTSAGFTEIWLEGAGHNYVTAPPQALLEELRQSLQTC